MREVVRVMRQRKERNVFVVGAPSAATRTTRTMTCQQGVEPPGRTRESSTVMAMAMIDCFIEYSCVVCVLCFVGERILCGERANES